MSDRDRNATADGRREAARWLAVAEEDLRIAYACIDLAPPARSGAAFHCQQAAEKVVKGLLVASGIVFRKTHDIDELSDLAAPQYPELVLLMESLRRLTVWGIGFRYPSLEEVPEPLPDVRELRAVLEVIGRLAEALRRTTTSTL